LRLDAVRSELLRQPGEETAQRGVRDAALELRVDLGVDRLRVEIPLDEPGGRAVGKALELGDAERIAGAERLEHERMREPRATREGTAGPVEPPLPAVRTRQRRGLRRLLGLEAGGGAKPLALRPRLPERARQRG